MHPTHYNALTVLGIGCILGFFISQVSFLSFGENGLWILSISGVGFLFLGLLYKIRHPDVEKKEPITKEKKTIGKRVREWKV